MENILITESGLVCDNPKCDWEDKNITYSNYKEWINKPCPKCGDNLLTQEDYDNAEVLQMTIDIANKMNLEELQELAKLADCKNLMDNPIFKDTKGLDILCDDTLSPHQPISFSVNTHKEIRITEIKKEDLEDK